MSEIVWLLESPQGAAVVVGRGDTEPGVKPHGEARINRYVPVMEILRGFGTFVVAWWALAQECRRGAYHDKHAQPSTAPILAGRSDGLEEAAGAVTALLEELCQTEEEQRWLLSMVATEKLFQDPPFVKRRQLEVMLRRASDLLSTTCLAQCQCAACALRVEIEQVLSGRTEP